MAGEGCLTCFVPIALCRSAGDIAVDNSDVGCW